MLNKTRNIFKKRNTKNIRPNTLLVGETSLEFICSCGKQLIWITEGKETNPCPKCGRKYI